MEDERGLATRVVVVSVFDYSFDRPALGDLGNVGVMRYFANDNQFTHGQITSPFRRGDPGIG